MRIEKYRWLAGLIAAHNNRTVIGRTRLQKEVILLQSLDFPTDYLYKTHFYGPYSEGVRSDLGLIDAMGLVSETENETRDGKTYFTIEATEDAVLPEIQEYLTKINIMEKADSIVLELAATYHAFRSIGSDHKEALIRLRRKKGAKCNGGNEEKALNLLNELKLETVA